MTLKVSLLLADAQATAFNTYMAGGSVVVYSGTRPTNPETALSGNTVLATFPLGTPAFTHANGVLTMSGLPLSETIAASGTATFFRASTSGGVAAFDGDVGTAGTEMIVATTTLVAAANLNMTAFTYTIPGV